MIAIGNTLAAASVREKGKVGSLAEWLQAWSLVNIICAEFRRGPS